MIKTLNAAQKRTVAPKQMKLEAFLPSQDSQSPMIGRDDNKNNDQKQIENPEEEAKKVNICHCKFVDDLRG